MKIKHIIWDWNGTLLDDLWLSIKAINIVLNRYQLPEIHEEKYLEIFTFPVIDYYERLGFDFEKQPFTVVGTEFIEEYTKRQLKPRFASRCQRIDDLSETERNHSIVVVRGTAANAGYADQPPSIR